MDRRDPDKLAECLDAVLVHGESLEQCLARYPDDRATLEPLLRIALGLARDDEEIPDIVRARVRRRVMREIEADPAAEPAAPPPPQIHVLPVPPRRSGRRWFLGIAAGILLLISSGSVTAAYAARSALPGDSLYSVKILVERAEFAFADPHDPAVHLSLAERRLSEAERLAKKGRIDRANGSLSSYRTEVTQATALLSTGRPLADADSRLDTHRRRVQGLIVGPLKGSEQAYDALLAAWLGRLRAVPARGSGSTEPVPLQEAAQKAVDIARAAQQGGMSGEHLEQLLEELDTTLVAVATGRGGPPSQQIADLEGHVTACAAAHCMEPDAVEEVLQEVEHLTGVVDGPQGGNGGEGAPSGAGKGTPGEAGQGPPAGGTDGGPPGNAAAGEAPAGPPADTPDEPAQQEPGNGGGEGQPNGGAGRGNNPPRGPGNNRGNAPR